MFLTGIPSRGDSEMGNYSLTRNRIFSVERVTPSGIPYFIRTTSDPERIRKMEREIEKEWLALVMERCDRELQEREILLAQARQYTDLRRTLAEEQAKLKETPFCDQLKSWQQQNVRV